MRFSDLFSFMKFQWENHNETECLKDKINELLKISSIGQAFEFEITGKKTFASFFRMRVHKF